MKTVNPTTRDEAKENLKEIIELLRLIVLDDKTAEIVDTGKSYGVFEINKHIAISLLGFIEGQFIDEE